MGGHAERFHLPPSRGPSPRRVKARPRSGMMRPSGMTAEEPVAGHRWMMVPGLNASKPAELTALSILDTLVEPRDGDSRTWHAAATRSPHVCS